MNRHIPSGYEDGELKKLRVFGYSHQTFKREHRVYEIVAYKISDEPRMPDFTLLRRNGRDYFLSEWPRRAWSYNERVIKVDKMCFGNRASRPSFHIISMKEE